MPYLLATANSRRPRPPEQLSYSYGPDPVPALRFTPYAWAKLLFFRDAGSTEIGGFGISATDDLLLVEDFVTVTQACTAATVDFSDDAVADYFEDQVDAGRSPEHFGRIWIHTHPGSSPAPSSIDEETFARVFGSCDWALMFILAKGGQTYARLRFNVGPGGQMLLPANVDFSQPFGPSATGAWKAEYDAHITVAAGDCAFAMDPRDAVSAELLCTASFRKRPRPRQMYRDEDFEAFLEEQSSETDEWSPRGMEDPLW